MVVPNEMSKNNCLSYNSMIFFSGWGGKKRNKNEKRLSFHTCLKTRMSVEARSSRLELALGLFLPAIPSQTSHRSKNGQAGAGQPLISALKFKDVFENQLQSSTS